MCGIWGYLSKEQHSAKEMMNIYEAFYNVKSRGPDNSSLKEFNTFMNAFVGFHRLSIMDTNNSANQPFEIFQSKTRTIYISCNGEIYNYKKIYEEENYTPKTGSDCEVIIMLYEKYGLDMVLEKIDGEFAIAIIIIDHNKEITFHLIRDHIGIRPLYYGIDEDSNKFAYSSDLKGMISHSGSSEKVGTIVKNVQHVLPGHCFSFSWTYNESTSKTTFKHDKKQFYRYDNVPTTITDLEEARKTINASLRKSVIDRLMTDRPLGSLLSGGLDSSLVAAIAAKNYISSGRKLRTFSVGMPGSTDKGYAEMVAKHIDSEHTHVEFSEEDFLKEIEQTIWTIGTFDITTIRASVGLVLISKWIAKNTDIKVLLTGEGADELNSGYMYFHNAPNPIDSHKENLRLLHELYIYDLLRGDRSIADFGLEARVPFLDRTFMNVILSIKPELRVPTLNEKLGHKVEKWLLRSAFENENLLPKEVLWRKKEAFSDGVSGEKRSWFVVIQEHAQKLYTDEEFETKKNQYAHLPPVTKESLYFREVFVKLYGSKVDYINPHYWLPLWSGNITDPSARVLDSYKREEKK